MVTKAFRKEINKKRHDKDMMNGWYGDTNGTAYLSF